MRDDVINHPEQPESSDPVLLREHPTAGWQRWRSHLGQWTHTFLRPGPSDPPNWKVLSYEDTWCEPSRDEPYYQQGVIQ